VLSLPARSLESQRQSHRHAVGTRSFHHQHMDALTYLNQERLVSSARGLEVFQGIGNDIARRNGFVCQRRGVFSYASGVSRSGNALQPLGGSWVPASPMPIGRSPIITSMRATRACRATGGGGNP